MINAIRIISIISYLFILLMGQMIATPFFMWLLGTAFDFGNIDQLFAVLGVIGVGIHFTKWRSSILMLALSFFFMLSPLVSRLVQVPLELFNYPGFYVPLAVFIISYLAFIAMNARGARISK